MERARVRRRVRALTGTTAVLALVACSDQSPSTLRPAGPGAARVETLWWVLFWISVAVCLIVIVGVILAVVRRRREGAVSRRDPVKFVFITGALLPFLVLAAMYGLSLRDTAALSRPPGGTTSLTVEVIGHQWWWEVRYPDTGVVTANEIHIPVDTDVEVRLRTDDVLHSFWVPQLMPKTDLISGKTNTTWIRADEVGTYRGRCAEYCGLQHAHMGFVVVAEPRPEYDAWLAWARGPADAPTTAAQRRGLEVFMQGSCAGCHSIRGTGANGGDGPNLTTVGDRWSLGAGSAANDPGHMRQWIDNPQQLKPGNAMPPQPMPPADLSDLVDYLQSLKQPGNQPNPGAS